jgi:DNA mismatch repair ATPase MutL
MDQIFAGGKKKAKKRKTTNDGAGANSAATQPSKKQKKYKQKLPFAAAKQQKQKPAQQQQQQQKQKQQKQPQQEQQQSNKKQQKNKQKNGGNNGAPLNDYHRLFALAHKNFPDDMPLIFDEALPGGDARRQELFGELDGVLPLIGEYAWAVPDERALRIIKHFGDKCGGVVEIGAGLGYWGSLLRARGVTYTGYDRVIRPTRAAAAKTNAAAVDAASGKSSAIVGAFGAIAQTKTADQDDDDDADDDDNGDDDDNDDDNDDDDDDNDDGDDDDDDGSGGDGGGGDGEEETFAWCELRKGGPAALGAKKLANRALMLCYPDDFEVSGRSLAHATLQAYKGDTIICIGELLSTGSLLDNPWGRSGKC